MTSANTNTNRLFKGAGPDSILLLMTGVVDCWRETVTLTVWGMLCQQK